MLTYMLYELTIKKGVVVGGKTYPKNGKGKISSIQMLFIPWIAFVNLVTTVLNLLVYKIMVKG